MGGRIKIGMEGITKRVGRKAGYYKSMDGGREGVGEGGGRENITNEIIETVISATGVYLISMM